MNGFQPFCYLAAFQTWAGGEGGAHGCVLCDMHTVAADTSLTLLPPLLVQQIDDNYQEPEGGH